MKSVKRSICARLLSAPLVMVSAAFAQQSQPPDEYLQSVEGQSVEGYVQTSEGPKGETLQFPEALGEGHARLITTIGDTSGSFVEWFEPVDSDEIDRIGVGVGAKFPTPPLVSTKFVESHTPLEVFLAIADPLQAPPPELVRHAIQMERLAPLEKDARDRLRRENEETLRGFTVTGSDTPHSCSPAFTNWVGQVFGSASCGGTSGNFTSFKETYCTAGCNHQLGSVDKGWCVPALLSCDQVQATNRYYAGRLGNFHGDGYIGLNGQWQHFLAANCQGNGPFSFKRTRGSSVAYKSVPVGYAYHYFWGNWPVATATTNVTYGSWQHGIPASGSSYKLNRMDLINNTAPGDTAILCGDIRYERDMSDISSPSCHGPNISLCTGGNCDSECFHCAGGTCN